MIKSFDGTLLPQRLLAIGAIYFGRVCSGQVGDREHRESVKARDAHRAAHHQTAGEFAKSGEPIVGFGSKRNDLFICYNIAEKFEIFVQETSNAFPEHDRAL